jgi:hypothetical protein
VALLTAESRVQNRLLVFVQVVGCHAMLQSISLQHLNRIERFQKAHFRCRLNFVVRFTILLLQTMRFVGIT